MYGAAADSAPPRPLGEATGVASTPPSPWRSVAHFGAAVVACGVLVGLIGLRSSPDATSISLASADVSWTVSNEYERRLGYRIGEGIYPWAHTVELYRVTTMEVSDVNGACPTLIAEVGFGKVHEVEGCSAEFVFKETGKHKVKASWSSGDIGDREIYVMARYVRWELRELTEEHRADFFDGLQTLYNVDTVAGMATYGSKYTSMQNLVEKHLLGAADKECDHWHDDAGILTHHMAFTLEAEQSLQAVNPSLAIPYWDYTLDQYRYENWVDSPVFSDEWFGPADPSDEKHIINTGRWAYTSVIRKEGANGDRTHNPYGLLRSPWNTNPTPYLLRSRFTLGAKDAYFKIPGCKEFHSAFSDDLASMLAAINGLLHGPVHIMVGGHWHSKAQYYKLSAELEEFGHHQSVALRTDISGFLLQSKFLWRQGLVRCPEMCGADTAGDMCTCSCMTEELGFANASTLVFDYGGADFNLISSMYSFWVTPDTTQKFRNSSKWDLVKEELAMMMCHVGWPGEMFTSAAPYDPIFWSLHGLAERFVSMKRVEAVRLKESTFDETWSYTHEVFPSDTHVVCDWEGVTGMELPTCTKGTCPGHHENDMIPFGNFTKDGKTLYTNKEFYEFLHPFNEDLPYVYSNLFRWPACEEQNVTWWDVDAMRV